MLAAVVDPVTALLTEAPIPHVGLTGNITCERRLYRDHECAFAGAAYRTSHSNKLPARCLHSA